MWILIPCRFNWINTEFILYVQKFIFVVYLYKGKQFNVHVVKTSNIVEVVLYGAVWWYVYFIYCISSVPPLRPL